MNKNPMTIEAEKRRDGIVKLLMDKPRVIFTYQDLENDFSISHATLFRDMKILQDKYPKIIMNRGQIMYDSEVPVKNQKKKKDVNQEGYLDPTAASALRNVEPEKKDKAVPKVGEVWNIKAMSGAEELYLVVGINFEEGFATCTPYKANEEEVSVKFYTKPLKYFLNKSWGMPISYMTKVKNTLGEYFGIEPETVEVEKIVEVTKEVPAKVSGYSQSEVDTLLAMQKAEIYEECFKLMVKR